jgi:hypothetical protein
MEEETGSKRQGQRELRMRENSLPLGRPKYYVKPAPALSIIF